MKPFLYGEFQKGLRTKSFGRSFIALSRVTSTNDLALKLAAEGVAEGTVVVAEEQTKGRGRQGRRWETSPGKALAFSIVLRPRAERGELSGVTLAAAVAVAQTLEDLRLKPGIKWPNDVLLGGKKICGILTEMGVKKDKMTPLVLGIGLNLNQSSRDIPKDLRGIATSCYLVSGREVDRSRFLQRLLLRLEKCYGWVVTNRLDSVLAEWRRRSIAMGKSVKVSQGHRVFYGEATGVDGRGALWVRKIGGEVETVLSGDVEILGSTLKRMKRKGRS
jgi:BirA family biotin operon repressor/biotin-[acetyl-CoA-carboxylase] ligase